ncbi:hypothetical protein R2R70_02270 [Cobetia sp. SIMBA_158]|uniref:hypothetical protein n=1 Tax=Cobetia sp. SIMBA_158 TaxID=3081617 RepID=UPI003980C285
MTEQIKKRMTPAQWTEARAMWASGEFTLEQISEKFAVTRETLSRRFKKDGVVKGQSQVDKRVEEEIVQQVVSNQDKWAERAEHVRETYYKTAETIRNMNLKVIGDAMKGPGAFSAQPDLKALGMLISNLEKLRVGQFAITGLDKELAEDDEIPELLVRSLTDSEIQSIRDAQSAPQEDDEIELGDVTPYLEDLAEEEEGLVVEGEED